MAKKVSPDTNLTAAFWRTSATEGFYTKTATGAEVRMRTFALQDYLLSGKIPDGLQKIALSLYNKGIEVIDINELESIRFIDYVLVECLIEPKAKLDPQDVGENEIYVHHIPDPDRLNLFTKALGNINVAREKLAPFS